ncbi:hypothetical protein [Microbulbifer thermotolerans]|uniref:Uncharacterized protein n=1 Tax=Microbulbifer thermotolerans TaxID=252514 RepID=A0A143HP19_MICTH|nr:hypothetical protein [Microbulbifer thermotolerans]AMX03438.1 hypothetical protein A3224_13420 [Microbulbifer thermotolerans]
MKKIITKSVLIAIVMGLATSIIVTVFLNQGATYTSDGSWVHESGIALFISNWKEAASVVVLRIMVVALYLAVPVF